MPSLLEEFWADARKKGIAAILARVVALLVAGWALLPRAWAWLLGRDPEALRVALFALALTWFFSRDLAPLRRPRIEVLPIQQPDHSAVLEVHNYGRDAVFYAVAHLLHVEQAGQESRPLPFSRRSSRPSWEPDRRLAGIDRGDMARLLLAKSENLLPPTMTLSLVDQHHAGPNFAVPADGELRIVLSVEIYRQEARPFWRLLLPPPAPYCGEFIIQTHGRRGMSVLKAAPVPPRRLWRRGGNA